MTPPPSDAALARHAEAVREWLSAIRNDDGWDVDLAAKELGGAADAIDAARARIAELESAVSHIAKTWVATDETRDEQVRDELADKLGTETAIEHPSYVAAAILDAIDARFADLMAENERLRWNLAGAEAALVQAGWVAPPAAAPSEDAPACPKCGLEIDPMYGVCRDANCDGKPPAPVERAEGPERDARGMPDVVHVHATPEHGSLMACTVDKYRESVDYVRQDRFDELADALRALVDSPRTRMSDAVSKANVLLAKLDAARGKAK